ncbi:MAG TPA: Fic family protein [Vicinamibacteria bacterium]
MATNPPERILWKPIDALPAGLQSSNGSIAALEALRGEWARRFEQLSEEERAHVRQRSLRRLSIETGIIERLYDIDWGLTLHLVAEGFTKDVVERAGGAIDDRTLETIRAHRDSLEMVLDYVRENRQLSPGFIKELHHAITRTQSIYIVRDALGRIAETALPHGEWKKQPNHVERRDGVILEYCPPEHVASEIDRLLEMWAGLDRTPTHPIVKASWLHHRFVQIHPFADGNGRVARALTLLVLTKERYAPLVVDRFHREKYLIALDAANEGDLRPLVKLFINLESVALTNELERPRDLESSGVSTEVARTLASQLAELRKRKATAIERELKARAINVLARIDKWFGNKRRELEKVFRDQGLEDVRIFVQAEQPPKSTKTHWYRQQVIDAAHAAGHYADFRFFAAWIRLAVEVEQLRLSYVASLHGAGRDPGVMAVTTFAELRSIDDESDAAEGGEKQNVPTTEDAFRFVHSENVENLNERATELEEMLDEGLANALAKLMSAI